MGAKTSEDDHSGGNGQGPLSSKPSSAGGEPRGVHLARDGDGSLGGDGGDDGDDDDKNNAPAGPLTDGAGKKKKKRKPKKKKKAPTQQSSPPRVPLSDLFREFPAGEIQDYNTARTTAEEVRFMGRRQLEDPEFLNDYRKAAEVHRQVRQWTQDNVKPGDKLIDVANGIEDGVRALLGNQGIEPGDNLKSGMGFPTGLCLNHETAHYTPNPGQKDVVLKYEDVMKVDFGVQINGWIVDSAFTMSFDPTYDNLLNAVKDATNSGIKASGIDVRICDVSAAIQEAMESYEVEINGKTYPVKPVRNISAHNIKHYQIHGGKSIPFIKNNDQTKMEEGEVFAIETFGTTGTGRLYDDFGTIVFCRRYLERLGQERYLAGLNSLVSNGILEAYEPLADIKGSYSAQFEHTILLRESHKEVISRGSDY
ncbi:hypothetical protein J7337_002200 [Fusarium musae]|uniref:Methionine aminopeptidase 2 n=1 Tax=Fusarium musae TaxID=1042133 RepID=A0A9P8ITG8_9HYPO|nr:hypothetical protein J7337_002200 [Fusarium musae]KAG9505234.1 hypothetical protein J7337_002200 [Fusarium musae]